MIKKAKGKHRGKRILAGIVLLAMALSLAAIVQKDPERAMAANEVYIEGIGYVTIAHSGKDGYDIYLDKQKNLIVVGQYFSDSAATLSYHTGRLFFATEDRDGNPTSGKYYDVNVMSHKSIPVGSNLVLDTYTVPRVELEKMISELYGRDALKTKNTVYMSEGFYLKQRPSASVPWSDSHIKKGKPYNSLSAIRGAANWSEETYDNFINYYDIELTLNLAKYNITVTAGEGGNVSQSGDSAYEGDDVEVKAYPNDGYNFDGWTVIKGNISGFDVDAAENAFSMPGEDIELKANFVKKNTPDPTKAPAPTPDPDAPVITPDPTPVPEPSPMPTYAPAQSSRIDKSSVRYYTTDAGITMNRLYVGDITPKDSTFGYLASIYYDNATRITDNPTTAKGSEYYSVGRDSSGNEWYFIPSGSTATYVHPKTYKGYAVDSADVRYITELTFPEKITCSGTSYTVTSIGGGTDSYNEYSYNRDPDSYEIWTTDIIENNYSQNLSWNGGNFRESIVARISNTFGVIGNGEILSYGLDGYYYDNGLSEVECYENSYYVYNTTLQFVTVPSTVTVIEAYAFYNCQALKRIIGGDGVVTIGTYAFSGAEHLSPEISSIKYYPGGSEVHSYKYNYYNGAYAFGSPTANMLAWKRSVALPEYMQLPELGVLNTIDEFAFARHNNLFDVALPDTVIHIGSGAFYACCLNSVTVPGKTAVVKGDYETLGTKGTDTEKKTLIITNPNSYAMEYGLVYSDYYDLRAGYAVTYHSNSTPAETYVTKAQTDVTSKALKERIEVSVHESGSSYGGYVSYTNEYEVFLDVDGGLWLKRESAVPEPCMDELTFHNIYGFSVIQGSGSSENYSGTTLYCCLAFADNGTVWGYRPDTVTWVKLGVPEGSSYVHMHERECSSSGGSYGESKKVLSLYFLNAAGEIACVDVFTSEGRSNMYGSSSSYTLYESRAVAVSMPSSGVSFAWLSVQEKLNTNFSDEFTRIPAMSAKDTNGTCWKYDPDYGWQTAGTFEALTTGAFDEEYSAEALKPTPVSYKFVETLYDLMFDAMGREFLGWTLRADGTGTLYQPGDVLSVTAPTTVYAKWDGAAKKKIVYIPNGGYGKMEDDVYPADTPNPVTLRKNNPPDDGYVRNGYEFAGWSYKEKPGSTDTIYADGASIVIGLGTTKLYAQWEPVTYTVKVGTEDMRVMEQSFIEYSLGLDDTLRLGTMEDKVFYVSYNLNDKETQPSMYGKAEFVTALTAQNTEAFLEFYGWRIYEDVNRDGKINEIDRYVGYYEAESVVKNLATEKNEVFYAFPHWTGSASYVHLPEIVCEGYVFVGYTPGTAYAPDRFETPEAYNQAIRENLLIPAPVGSRARYQPKSDGEVLHAYYEREAQEGKVYGFEVYDVYGIPAWEEIAGEENHYTIGIQEGSDVWNTLPLRSGVHPVYRNMGGLPTGGGFYFHVVSTGEFAEEDVKVTIYPYLCPVGEQGYDVGDLYFEQETDRGSFLKMWKPEELAIILYADRDSAVAADGSSRIWTGSFQLPQTLWVAQPGTDVAEYQQQYGLNFEEAFWIKDARVMLRFALSIENGEGECFYYGMLPEEEGENVWVSEAGEPYREDYDENYYKLFGGEVAVIYPGDSADKWNRVYGIY